MFKIWGIASLVLLALAWLAGLIFGPFAPWKLKRKLGVALLASLALSAAYVLCYFALPDQFNGPALKNIIAFSLKISGARVMDRVKTIRDGPFV